LLQIETPSSDEVLKTYLEIKKTIREDHQRFCSRYNLSTTKTEKETVTEEAKSYLIKSMLGDIVPAWKRTDWTFNGYSDYPRRGSIACGWFIQRVLEHLDFTFDKKHTRRPYFAQNWPIEMVNGLDNRSWNFPDSTSECNTIDDHIATLEEDIYIIGFARSINDPGGHIGFLITSSSGPFILHSLMQVECTPTSENLYYKSSDFFYLGKVFNDRVMKCWLEEKPLLW